MHFTLPVDVYEEDACVRRHAKELAALGRHALIITGHKSASKTGALQDTQQALASCGLLWTLFDEVEENPSVETVLRASRLGREAGCDFVIGIGGGSPMDAAKAAALLLAHPDAGEAFLFDREAPSNALPIACIPTTCGTGSEVTGASILTRTGRKMAIAHRLFPRLALLDGSYLTGLPASVLANTSMDAFCHLAESYVNRTATPYSRMCVAAGLAEWAKYKPIVLGQEEANREARAGLLRASAFGGMAIAQTGTVLPHGLSYTLTVHTGMPHGKACGYFLGRYLAEASPALRDAVLRMAGFRDLDAFETYYEASCGRDAVRHEVLELCVEQLLQNRAKTALAPFPVDAAVLRRIAG